MHGYVIVAHPPMAHALNQSVDHGAGAGGRGEERVHRSEVIKYGLPGVTLILNYETLYLTKGSS